MAVLLLLTLGWIFLPRWLPARKEIPDEADRRAFVEAVSRWEEMTEEGEPLIRNADSFRQKEGKPGRENLPATLFYFDPNQLDSAGWTRLGLRKSVIRTILRYRARGGRFRKPEDLRKVYGLWPTEADRLLPYVQMKGKEADSSHFSRKAPAQSVRYATPAIPEPLDINQADSADWESLPGIGPRLASRILRFREQLGGFWSVDQVGETYGLADSVFFRLRARLACRTSALRQLDLNTESAEKLAKHPYLSWKLARLIVRYREQHGPYSKLSDLLQIDALTPEQLDKIKPYVKLTTN